MRREPKKQQVLRTSAVARRADALFKAMSTDYLLREQFVTDPAQIFFEYVYGTRLPPEKAAASNQLLYSVMSSRRLLSWFNSYFSRHRRNPPSSVSFMKDFCRAVVENGAQHVVFALMRSLVEEQSLVSFRGSFPGFLFELPDLRSESTDTGTTEAGTDTGTTEPGTETGPTEPATETGPGGRVSVLPDYWNVTVETIAKYAEQLQKAGALDIAVSE